MRGTYYEDDDSISDNINIYDYDLNYSNKIKESYGYLPKVGEGFDTFRLKLKFDINDKKKDDEIKRAKISSDTLILTTKSNKILKCSLNKDKFEEYKLEDAKEESIGGAFGFLKNTLTQEKKAAFYTPHKIFLDPQGIHCLLTSSAEQNFYLHKNSNVLRMLKTKEKITAIIFDENCSETQARVLIGTRDGKLGLLVIDINPKTNEINEKEFKVLIDKVDKTQQPQPKGQNTFKPIVELSYFNLIEKAGPAKSSRVWMVLILTQDSLYYIRLNVSNMVDFESLEKYNNPNEQIPKVPNPIPENIKTPLFHCYSKINKENAASSNDRTLLGHSIIYYNGGVMSLFAIPKKIEKSGEYQFFNSSQPLEYFKRYDAVDERSRMIVAEHPAGLACSEYHYYILHKDCLTIISRINGKVVTFFDIQNALGFIFEPSCSSLYLYTIDKIFEIDLKDEGNDIWRLHLENNKIKEAYDTISLNSPFRDYVASAYAEELFRSKRFVEAANLLMNTKKSFEEISLEFLRKDSEQGLKVYYDRKVDKLKENEKVKRMVLQSTLLEMAIFELNSADKTFTMDNKVDEKIKENMMNEESKRFVNDFLNSRKNDFDENLTYSLLQSHGRFKECLEYARMKGNIEMIIKHYINEHQYAQALKEMSSQSIKTTRKKELIYEYAHVFMKKEPELTMKFILEQVERFNPTKLLEALMNIPYEKRDKGIDFMFYCIKTLECNEEALHNMLILFLSSIEDKSRLYDYLYQQEIQYQNDKILNFNLDFALGNFKKSGDVKAELIIYGIMKMYPEAVYLALVNGLYEEAKDYANKPVDDSGLEDIKLKKKLWLQIVVYLLEHDADIDLILKTVTDSNKLVKVEDLIPHLNQNIKIEKFEKEITASIDEYVKKINILKMELNEYEQSTDYYKNEIRNAKMRYIETDPNKRCDECAKILYDEESYIFPCNHGFHKNCLRNKLPKLFSFDQKKIADIEKCEANIARIQQDLMNLNNANNAAQGSKGTLFAKKTSTNEKKEGKLPTESKEVLQKNLQDEKERLEFLLSTDCLVCGSFWIDTISIPLDNDEKLRKEWDLGLAYPFSY